MKKMFLIILVFSISCLSMASSDQIQHPFLIFAGSSLECPYIGSATQTLTGDIVVAFEKWTNATSLPFESHILIMELRGETIVKKNVPLNTNDQLYTYHPNFLISGSNTSLYFNQYDPKTQQASFAESKFANSKFLNSKNLVISDDLNRQFRPWLFPNITANRQVVLTYEWKDPITRKNRLKMTKELSPNSFGQSVDMGSGVMPHFFEFENGTKIFIYQNGTSDQSLMMNFVKMSTDGISWGADQPISSHKGIHDVNIFKRLDGLADIYYVVCGEVNACYLTRRVLDAAGGMGPEQVLTSPTQGSFMEPHPTRLADGRIFIVLTKEVVNQSVYDLWGMYLSTDSPNAPK